MDKIKEVADTVKVVAEVFPKSTKSIDEVVSTVIDGFNLLLYPIKKASVSFNQRLEEFTEQLRNRIHERGVKNIQYPDKAISLPLLEALRYDIDNDELRNMFAELLVTAIDGDTAHLAHPSYVDIIRRMSSFDARLFRYLVTSQRYIPAINPVLKIVNDTAKVPTIYPKAMPEWYIDAEDFNSNIFQTSSSLQRLRDFGLVELMRNTSGRGEDYSWAQRSQQLLKIVHDYSMVKCNKVKLEYTRSIVSITDNGVQFASACSIDHHWISVITPDGKVSPYKQKTEAKLEAQ